MASPNKGRIRNRQSIGRGLRLHRNKLKMILFDIADDLRVGSHMNTTLHHFVERLKLYHTEKFPYKIYKIGPENGTHSQNS